MQGDLATCGNSNLTSRHYFVQIGIWMAMQTVFGNLRLCSALTFENQLGLLGVSVDGSLWCSCWFGSLLEMLLGQAPPQLRMCSNQACFGKRQPPPLCRQVYTWDSSPRSSVMPPPASMISGCWMGPLESRARAAPMRKGGSANEKRRRRQ